MDRVVECREVLIRRLSEALAAHGFRETPDEFDAGKFHFYQWERPGGWKVDVVKVSFSRNLPRCCDVGLFVELPSGDDRDFLDTIGLQAATGRGKDYCMPDSPVAFGWRCNRFASEVCQDLELGLRWFGNYPAAGKALEMLRAGQIENAPRGGPVRARFEQHLQAFADARADETTGVEPSA